VDPSLYWLDGKTLYMRYRIEKDNPDGDSSLSPLSHVV
jgi:hypothetical protein